MIPRATRLAAAALAVAALIAIGELIAHGVQASRAVDAEDWAAVGAHLRERFEPGDTILVSPEWADPLLRTELGDLIPPPHAGRSDLAAYRRVFEVSLRGHRSPWVQGMSEASSEDVGRVRIRRYDLGEPSVRYDLVEHLADAQVTLNGNPCPRVNRPNSTGGAFRGPAIPRERFHCGPEDYFYIGQTVLEDLDLTPRYCVWTHPHRDQSVQAVRYEIPNSERFVFYSGMEYGSARELHGGAVTVDVAFYRGDVLLEEGYLDTHRDGDGWKRVERAVPEGADGVEVRIFAVDPGHRWFCWAGSLRGPAREHGEGRSRGGVRFFQVTEPENE